MLVASEHKEEMTAAGANGSRWPTKQVPRHLTQWPLSGSWATGQQKKSFEDFSSEQRIVREDERHEEVRLISMQIQYSSLKRSPARSQPAKLG